MAGITLCVNIDHIATVRQARGEDHPDPLEGARICGDSGAAGITVHLREDRRHIQDRDVYDLKKIVRGKFNLEMALSREIIDIALDVRPHQVTLVPEKREELTTEGGLDVPGNFNRIREVAGLFKNAGILVSLFIEPDGDIVEQSKETGADYIEIHTGTYCNARTAGDIKRETDRIFRAARRAVELGIGVNAGHGLNCSNVRGILGAPGLEELNIGHSIISRSIFIGLRAATEEMIDIINEFNRPK